jgi:hypothetical protein
MKVLYIEPCTQFFGGYYRSLEICKALSRANIKVDLLISSDKKFHPYITHYKLNNNLTLFILPRFYINFYITGRILRGLIATVIGLIGRYDIIQASSPVQFESNIPLTILKFFGKKTVISWEDIWTDGVLSFNKYVTRYLKFWEDNAPRLFENVQCISQILVDRAKNLGAKNIIKLINGTDPAYFCPNKQVSLKKLSLDPKLKYLLIFGNTFDGQRTYMTLKTFQNIISLYPDTRLITNYDPKKLTITQPNIKKIKTSTFDKVINVGYIPEKLLPYYLSAADAILFIMGENLNEKACFPIRMSKFLSSGSVVIINENHSETTSVLKKYNCAIIDSDLKQLAIKTVKYFKSKHLQKTLHSSILAAKKELSWDNLVMPLISLYEKITK